MIDPPHLIKCTASLFRKHNVASPVKVGDKQQILEARFSNVRTAYEVIDQLHWYLGQCLKSKITTWRLLYEVCVATQTLSRIWAAFIYSLISKGEFNISYYFQTI